MPLELADWNDLKKVDLNRAVTWTKLNGSVFQLSGRTTPEGWPFVVLVAVAKPGNEPMLELVQKFHRDASALGAKLERADHPDHPNPFGV